MSRTSDSYDTLIRGVSQQVAHDRIEGQHWLQDNMISDPVRGLSRRHGSVQQALMMLEKLDDDDRADLMRRNEVTFFIDDIEFACLYRTAKRVGSKVPPLVIVNKDAKGFMPVRVSAAAAPVLADGITTLCTAGRYILIGANSKATSYTLTDNLAPSAGQSVVWVRGGAYSRTFIITVTVGGVAKNYEYTTMKSYYDQPLDTSDIPHLDPNDPEKPNKDYQKLVNDRTNAYNSAVNKHIADAAKDITPENIAEKLADLIKVDHPSVMVDGPYITFDIAGAVVTADDGGNGDFVRAVSQVITQPELATPKHFVGKVVKVQPTQAGSIPYYLQAVSSTGAGGFTEVSWKEAAGETVRPTFLFLVATFHNGELVVGLDAADLKAETGLDVPGFEPSRSGDTEQRALPALFGRKITHLRLFQDRLMMIAGSTVFMSRTGDYFNLFPESVLTLKADDPIEVFAQGSEDDTITAGVQHDRNLVLFGRRYQYIVPGQAVVTPQNAYIGIAATYEGANLTPPTAAGSLLFFCQRREQRLTMQQMQPGSVADRLEAFDVSAQLDGYLSGTPQQIVAMTSPSAVFIKTAEFTNGFYVYSFLDSNDQTERLFDSWSRWVFDPSLGVLCGITSDDSGLLAVTGRLTTAGPALVLDRFTRETDLSDRPYLDSQMPLATHNHGEYAYGVFDARTDRALLGAPLEGAATLAARFPEAAGTMWVGALYDSVVVLTSPYLRDRNDKIILDAKLTVTKKTVSLANSAGIIAQISTDGGKTWRTTLDWVARAVGGWVLNTQAVPDQQSLTVPVMKDNKTYRLKLASRNWLPLTISVVEWSGQAFTSRR